MTAPFEKSRRRFLQHLAGTSAFATLATTLPAAGAPRRTVTATTRSGRIAGLVDRGVHVDRGVPYGTDTRTRRFQRALRETAWTGVRDAVRFGASAPQRGDADGQANEVVARPAQQARVPRQPLPVLDRQLAGAVGDALFDAMP